MIECRGCGRELKKGTGEKKCFYGGFVCSRSCDINACVLMESSMPGAGHVKHPGCFAMDQIRLNWEEDNENHD